MMDGFPTTIGPGIELPERMIQRLINWNGRETLQAWFEELPPRLDAWCAEWEIDLEPREIPDTVSLVLFGTSRRVGSVVIKIGPPNYERNAEIEATRAAAGDGMVRVIADDPDLSLIMLERLQPGTMLIEANLPDDEATRIAATRLCNFWRTPAEQSALIPLERWTGPLRTFTPRGEPDFPNALVMDAQARLERMLATPTSRSMLHGDLHHHNILLQDGYGWTTIDPKGLVGERGFDITAWMMNPWGFPTSPDFLPLANQRLDILAELLDEERERLAQWCVVFAALNLCWMIDVEHPEDFANDTELLLRMYQLLDA
ncbi:MAG TPA: aminoglycoside phosphotransferase family protein [Thermomicrobiales bacterium]|nr:aminoglycoside phosphotransferase family protein [Thermomicrobiales bacterium]